MSRKSKNKKLRKKNAKLRKLVAKFKDASGLVDADGWSTGVTPEMLAKDVEDDRTSSAAWMLSNALSEPSDVQADVLAVRYAKESDRDYIHRTVGEMVEIASAMDHIPEDAMNQFMETWGTSTSVTSLKRRQGWPKPDRVAVLEAQVAELAWMVKLPVKYGDSPIVHTDDGSRRPRDCDLCGDALEFETLCIQCGIWACQHCDLGGFCSDDCKHENVRERANALEIHWEIDSVGGDGPTLTSEIDGWSLSITVVSRGWEIRKGGEVHNGHALSLEEAVHELREKIITLISENGAPND